MSVYRTPTGGRLGFPGPDTRAWAAGVFELAPAFAHHAHVAAEGLVSASAITLEPESLFHPHFAGASAVTPLFSVAPAGAFHAHAASESALTAGGAPVPAYMSGGSVQTDGWQMVASGALPSGPMVDSAEFDVSRPGFTATGGTTTYTDKVRLRKRIREPYPTSTVGLPVLTTDKVASSKYIYAGDVIAGMTNNSTVTSPKPIANWAMLSRQIVQNSLTLEVTAWHRNGRSGRQVACVEYIVSGKVSGVDTTLPSVFVSTTVVSGKPSDGEAVLVYRGTVDITSLDPGLVTVNCKVYPWFGRTADGSVLDSTASSVARELSPRYFCKKTSATEYAYVSSTGSDGSGVISTNAATAEASPFLTVAGALNAKGTGANDGLEIRLLNSVTMGTTTASRVQSCGTVIITRAPGTAKSAAILSGAAFRFRITSGLTSPLTTAAVTFRDMTIQRSGTTVQFSGTDALDVFLDDVAYNAASTAGLITGSLSSVYINGMQLSNITAPLFVGTNSNPHLSRGITGNMNGQDMDAWLMLGCDVTNVGTLSTNSRSQVGSIVAFNRIGKATAATLYTIGGGAVDGSRSVFAQNLCEFIESGSGNFLGLAFCPEATSVNQDHYVVCHNTVTGFGFGARNNNLYNLQSAAPSANIQIVRMAFVGNIWASYNTKHDTKGPENGARIGGWPSIYGVDWQGNWTQFVDADLGDNAAEDQGRGSSVGTSSTVRNNPLWVAYQGPTDAVTDGTYGGDYRLQNTSPARNIVADAVLSHDLNGTARALTNDAAGAYVAVP